MEVSGHDPVADPLLHEFSPDKEEIAVVAREMGKDPLISSGWWRT
jgi:hypothetical protein